MGPGGGTRAAAELGLRGPPATGGRDPTARAGSRQGQLLPARGGPRPRWRRWLRLQGSGSAAASPSQHPPPRSARAAGPRPEQRRRARGSGWGRGAILGRTRAGELEPLGCVTGGSRAGGPSLRDPRASMSPAAQSPSPAAIPAPGSQGSRALPQPPPTPAQPGTALHHEALDSPCAAHRAPAPHPGGATHRGVGAGAAVAVPGPRPRGEGLRGGSLLCSCGNTP